MHELGERFAAGVDAMAAELLADATHAEALEFWQAFDDWFASAGYDTKE